MIYGYARVSTDGQSVDAQVKQLRAAGAERVYRKTASGARSDRAQLRLALAQLGKGDVLTVTRLDRLSCMRCCEAAQSSKWRSQSPTTRQEAEPSSPSGSDPSVPTMMRHRPAGSLPLRAEVTTSDGYARFA